MIVVKNEFAHIAVSLDESANGPRLRLQDLRTQRVFYLDPLEVESLIWSTHGDLAQLLDPSFRRWNDDINVVAELHYGDEEGADE